MSNHGFHPWLNAKKHQPLARLYVFILRGFYPIKVTMRSDSDGVKPYPTLLGLLRNSAT
jgi:hypothetical protein